MINEQQYQEIKRRVKRISGFYRHLAIYVLVIAGLAAINLMTYADEIWFIYPMLGWGIGIAAHGFSVFVGEGWTKSWEERKIRELLEKESKTN